MSRFLKWMIALSVVTVICLLLLLIGIFRFATVVAGAGTDSSFLKEKRAHLAILRIEEPILSSDKYLKEIHNIISNSSCKGVVLRINSPGGAVAASQEIYHALLKLRDKNIPVIISMGNIAASGGYYIALGGDKIFSNPGTITGSIGVIMQIPVAEDLMQKLGVSVSVIKSGDLKDAGSMFRQTTDADRKSFRYIIEDLYDQFIIDIMKQRNISRVDLLKNADGRVFSGRQALKAGLIDTLGGFEDAKAYLAKLKKMGDSPLFIEMREDIPWMEKIISKSMAGLSSANLLNQLFKNKLYYLWRPASAF